MAEKNMEKYATYKAMHENLTRAMRSGFYYEAIFIEYAIVEDRCVSMLKHAGLKYQEKDGTEISLNKKLNKLNSCRPFTDKDVKKKLGGEIIEEVRSWKEERNALIHHLATIPYDAEEVERIALSGQQIVKKLASKSASVNRLLDKKNNQQ